MAASILPFVHVRGSWGEMGYQVGQVMAPLVRQHVDAWLQHVMKATGCTRDAALVSAAPFAASIQEHAPFLWEELEGLARGSGVPLGEVLMLPARAEVMRAQQEARMLEQSFECTTFAAGGNRTAGGAVWFGQNVDLVPFVEAFGIIVRQYPNDAPATLMYTTAGLLGHNGLNEAGVGICANFNFIDDPNGWRDGLPRYLLSRLALRQERTETALQATLTPPRAASRNLLIADTRGVFIDAELLTDQAALIHGGNDLLVHANHLEAEVFEGFEAPHENSLCRRQRLQELFDEASSPLRVADMQGFYRDHKHAPHSLCAHPFEGRNLQTVASVIGNLRRKGQVLLFTL